MNPTSLEVIATALGGTYTARGDAVAVVEALKAAGYLIVSIPKDSTGRDLDVFWRCKPIDAD